MGKTRPSNDKKGGKESLRVVFDRVSSALHNDTAWFVIGATLLVASIFLIIACISFIFNGGVDQSVTDSSGLASDVANSAGSIGARVSQVIIDKWFGIPSFLILIFVFVLGCNLMRITHFRIVRWFVSCTFLTFWLSILFSLVLTPLFSSSFIVPGGNHGTNVTEWLSERIGLPGTILVLLFTMLIYCIWLTRRTVEWIRERLSFRKQDREKKTEDIKEETLLSADDDVVSDDTSNTKDERLGIMDDDFEDQEDQVIRNGSTDNTHDRDQAIAEDEEFPSQKKNGTQKKSEGSKTAKDIKLTVLEATKEEEYEGEMPEPYNPRLDLSHYKFPTADLLAQYDESIPSDNADEQQANKDRIINVLRSFGIGITSISATQGPTVTLYEITPAEGVRISKIRNLEDDIALSLAAYGIRIIAPIPGKGTIGIEVPNANPRVVPMKSIIKSKKFVDSKMELPVALGRTITNEIFMVDLAKMPHLLVAGATGMGKSVGLNTIVTSLLYKKHPAEMKLVMVDPKMVEFSIYASIEKHFLAKLPDENEAIITEPTKVVHTLKSLCTEMDNRYELLKDANVRSIIEYNKLFIDRKLNPLKGHRYLPYIVVVIDEFGDLIMTAGKEIEMPICRIAQKARAVGMHMIIATQRPTTNIITGTIKANFPARIAFRVTSMIDSRTILDRPGANQLIGRGDMLFSQGGDPERVQCAFVDTPEVNSICSYISRQQGYTTAYELPEYVDENEQVVGDGDTLSRSELDPIFEDAARVIVSSQQGSTSLIQRKFSIGYNRAGRIMDQLEKAGIVGPQDGSKPRQVLCMDDADLDIKLQGLI